MLTAQIEKWADTVGETRLFFPAHWEECGVYKDLMPLAPRYEVYQQIESDGALTKATLRCDGKIVGYWVVIVKPGLHYGTLSGDTDILWIMPEHRNGTGSKMLRECIENELRRRGVKFWMAASKTHTPIDRFLARSGFELFERRFAKWVQP